EFTISARSGNLIGETTGVAVPVAANVVGLKILVDEGLSIVGRVIDVGQAPVAGATIEIGDGFERMRAATSGSEGRWQVIGLRPGRCGLTAGAPRSAPSWGSVALSLAGLTEPIDLVVRPAGSIKGRVLGDNGEPAVGVSVSLSLMPLPETRLLSFDRGETRQ